MKVGYILDPFPSFTETFILNEMLELEAQGVELHIFALGQADPRPPHEEQLELVADCTQIEPIAPGSIIDFIADKMKSADPEAQEIANCLNSRLEETDPWRVDALRYCVPIAELADALGITHMHAHYCGLAAATAAEVSRLTGIPFSFALHSRDLTRRELTPKLLYQRMHEASFAITDSKANGLWAIERCGARAGSWLRLIYKGVDLMRWTTRPEGPRIADFIAIGALEERKGFDVLLNACAELKDRGHNFKTIIVGEGAQAQALNKLRDRLELRRNVDFLGTMTHEELRKLMARCGTLVAPNIPAGTGIPESTPGVIIEAMALGVPAIATPLGGVPELFEDPSSGWFVEPGDVESLARAMRRALKHSDETQRRGQAARRRVEESFSLEANISCLARMMYRSSRRKVANQTRTEEFAGHPV